MHWAAQAGEAALVHRLLDARARIDAPDAPGASALHRACAQAAGSARSMASTSVRSATLRALRFVRPHTYALDRSENAAARIGGIRSTPCKATTAIGCAASGVDSPHGGRGFVSVAWNRRMGAEVS